MSATTIAEARKRYRSMLALGVASALGGVMAPILLGRPLYSLFVMAAWGLWRAFGWRRYLERAGER